MEDFCMFSHTQVKKGFGRFGEEPVLALPSFQLEPGAYTGAYIHLHNESGAC